MKSKYNTFVDANGAFVIKISDLIKWVSIDLFQDLISAAGDYLVRMILPD